MERLLRAIMLQLMVLGLVLIGWGLAATSVQAADAFRAAWNSANNPLGLEGAVIIEPTLQPSGPAQAADESVPVTGMQPRAYLPEIVSGPAPTPTVDWGSAPITDISPPTATPRPWGPPEQIRIPSITLDAPVHIIPRLTIQVGEDILGYWHAPNEAAVGWHEGSAFMGEPGNTVLSGHHNIYGSVFARLADVREGDEILVTSGGQELRYVVTQVMLFEERSAPLQQRIENARWILPSNDERLTLVTCWPITSNTHRLIVVAVPAS